MVITANNIDKIRDEDGLWLNSKAFCEEGIKFMKMGRYCSEPYGSPSHKAYWTEQLRRCKEGHEISGHKITGDHYNYLNFTQIMIVEGDDIDSPTAKKETKCPDFWDGDFDYFWSIEIAKNGVANRDSLLTNKLEKEVMALLPEEEFKIQCLRKVDQLKMRVRPHPDYLNGGNHMIVGKSRRKGYSYKNAAICANTYNAIAKSVTLIGAFDKKYLYPKGTMGMASSYLSFYNEKTAWGKGREYVDKQEHKKASFRKMVNGMAVEAGYQSEIIALTFKDNPDAARGKDPLYVLFEEAGAFPNLKASYLATAPSLTAGRYITGQILIFGTGGDMEVGTADFAEMFYNPIQFGLMPFINIWDENAENSYCGFFHPVYLNMEGYYDEQGNSDVAGALAYEMSERTRITKEATSSLVLQSRSQEHPTCPSEAFLTISMNDFPIAELRQQYNRVVKEKLHIRKGQPVTLLREERELDEIDTEGNKKKVVKVVAKTDLENLVHPLWDYKPKTKDLRGGVVIYEYPIEKPPRGLYKIGFDPYRQQNSTMTVPSLGAVYVYKGTQKFSFTRDTLVAQYVGRPYSPDDVNRIVEMLAELYNTQVMFENEVTHVKDYFVRRKKVHLMAAQPDTVLSKLVNTSKTARIWGIHMAEKIKDGGEKYIKQWLLEERDVDEFGTVVLNLETIYDPALLEELMLYNRKGNFDRVMAFMMVMFQIAAEEENKVYGDDSKNSNAQDLLELMERQFKKRDNYGIYLS